MKPIRIAIVLIASLLSLAGSMALTQGKNMAQFRFVHVDPGSPALDIYVNGELAATNVTYGSATAYMGVQAGEVALRANLATTSVQLIEETLALAAEPTAAVLSSRADRRFYLVTADLSELAFGTTRFTLINALESAAAMRFGDANDAEFVNAELLPGAAEGPIEVEAGNYQVFVRSANAISDADGQRFETALAAGTSHFLIIHGSREQPQLLAVSNASASGDDSGRLRFVHAVAGAAPLDVRINDQLILPALAFGAPSQHIALPGGSHRIALFLGPAELMAEQLDIRAGQMGTVAIMGSNAGLLLRSFRDAADGVDESSAVVSLINAIPGSVISHLQLEGGAIAAFNVSFGEAGDAARIAPGKQSMTAHLEIGDDRGAVEAPARHFAGGSYYNIIALAGGAFSAPRLLIAETSLQRQVQASLPAQIDEAPEESEAPEAPEAAVQPEPETEQPADEQAHAEAPEEPPAQTEAAQAEQAAQPESPSAEASAAGPAAEAAAETEPQPAEDEAPTEIAPAPAEPAETERGVLIEAGQSYSSAAPYAIVEVDPDSALHIRQYPSSDAKSLGLLPAQSDVLVLGRRVPADSAPDALELLPEYLHDFTEDPVAALLPYQDLPAPDTWLYVVYITHDGGTLYGWVNAFYVKVFDKDGLRQRLASLAPVPQNQLGGATNTDILPPSLAEHVSARVDGLDADDLLNLRTGNSDSTEVLTQIAADSTLGFLGMDAAGAWALVQYESPQGVIVTGWASMDFIQLLLNGKPARAAPLRALDPSAVPIIGAEVSGAIQPAAPGAEDDPDQPLSGIVGEVDVNFDSALHLRRYPDATSESLALIPSGMRLQLDGVTESRDWYKVTYAGEEGWVAGDYLRLSMNGRRYSRGFLDGQLPRFTDAGD